MKLEQVQELIPQPLQTGLNWGAVGAAVGAFLDFLPGVAALFSIIWLGLQIWLFLFVKKPWKKGRS